MGIFSLTQEIAVDLGTANTIIIHNDKIVVDEPSYVALDSKGKLVAVGEKAKMMQERSTRASAPSARYATALSPTSTPPS